MQKDGYHSDEARIESGKYIMCPCGNAISIAVVNCPYCKRFNASTSAKQCPTCGNALDKPSLLASILALPAEQIATLFSGLSDQFSPEQIAALIDILAVEEEVMPDPTKPVDPVDPVDPAGA